MNRPIRARSVSDGSEAPSSRSVVMIHIGLDTYGKVDHVPGLFSVGTEFLHIQFFPLVPVRSSLAVDEPPKRIVSIGLSGKSVFFGYARALCLVGSIAGCIGTVVEAVEVL